MSYVYTIGLLQTLCQYTVHLSQDEIFSTALRTTWIYPKQNFANPTAVGGLTETRFGLLQGKKFYKLLNGEEII